ncbi:hypothetical protein EJ110_NYTH41874 [Nymphaea thermarum]|nr:hypothetical protein EJ110_NYTH41874 [Nymphaea thermarum]
MFSASILLQILTSLWWAGLCLVQQLVAFAISSHVCSGAYALPIFWRGFNSVSDFQGWRWMDGCSKISDWCFCCWKYCYPCNFEARQFDRDGCHVHRVHFLLHSCLHSVMFP